MIDELTPLEQRFIDEHPEMGTAELAQALLQQRMEKQVEKASRARKAREMEQAADAAKRFVTLRTPKRPGKRKGDSWTFDFNVLLSDLPTFAESAGVNYKRLLEVALGTRESVNNWTQGARLLKRHQMGKAYKAPRPTEPSIRDLTAVDLPHATKTPDRAVVYQEIPRDWHPGDTLTPPIPDTAMDLSAGVPEYAKVAKHAV